MKASDDPPEAAVRMRQIVDQPLDDQIRRQREQRPDQQAGQCRSHCQPVGTQVTKHPPHRGTSNLATGPPLDPVPQSVEHLARIRDRTG